MIPAHHSRARRFDRIHDIARERRSPDLLESLSVAAKVEGERLKEWSRDLLREAEAMRAELRAKCCEDCSGEGSLFVEIEGLGRVLAWCHCPAGDAKAVAS